jgi:hypothetical protein
MKLHPKTKKVCVDTGLKMDGKPLYRYENFADYTHTRHLMYEAFAAEYKSGLEREDLVAYIERALHCLKVKDVAMCSGILMTLHDLVSNYDPPGLLYSQAALVYFTMEEDITVFDYDVNRKKVEGFQAMDTDGFFLATFLKDLEKKKGLSDLEAQQIARKMKETPEMYRKIFLQKTQ